MPRATLHPLTSKPASLQEADLAAQFQYDPQAPLDVQDTGSVALDDVSRHDISYASPYGGRVPAYLFEPAGSGPFAGIVMVPGLGGTRADQGTDAAALAARGAVVLTITASHMRDGHDRLFTFTSRDREELIQTTIDLRRAVDLLLATGKVDPSRLGYVGFSHGAAMGGILAGVEKRIKAYALQSGGGLDFLARMLPDSVPASERTSYLDLMATVDQIRYIGHAAPAALLLQNGTQDAFWKREELDHWFETASEPKTTRWYEAAHGLNAQAEQDKLVWLQAQLGLS